MRLPENTRPVIVLQKLAYMAADRAVRVFAPMALDAAGLLSEAEELGELLEIVDVETAEAARIAATKVAGVVSKAEVSTVRSVIDAAWSATEAAALAAKSAKAGSWIIAEGAAHKSAADAWVALSRSSKVF